MKEIEFTAAIIEKGVIGERNFVVLDKTLFYPDGKGGQIGDRGKIANVEVLEVVEDQSGILHIVSEIPNEAIVKCIIDSSRRADASIQHTAQHIISQAFVNLYNIETLSFHMGEEVSSIDLNSVNISQAEITSAESLCNDVVLENRKVNKFFITENDLDKYSLRKKEEIEGPIRIVEIEGFDISMCGGTHVDFTGEIGLIKVIKSERQKRELTRLSFVAGKRALKDYSSKSYLVSSLSEFLTTGEEEILGKVKKLDNENRVLSKESRNLKQSILELQAKIVFGEEKDKNPAGTYIERELNELGRDDFLAFAKTAANSYDMPFFLSSSKEIFIVAFRLSKILEENCKSIKDKILSETHGKVWNLSNDTIAVICDQTFKEILRRIFLEQLS